MPMPSSANGADPQHLPKPVFAEDGSSKYDHPADAKGAKAVSAVVPEKDAGKGKGAPKGRGKGKNRTRSPSPTGSDTI